MKPGAVTRAFLLVTVYGSRFTNSFSLPLVNVRQRLLRRGALRRAVVQYGDLLKRVETRARLDVDRVRRRGRAGLDFDDGSDAEARRVNFVLPRGDDVVADVHGFKSRHVAHLKKSVPAEAANRPDCVRRAELTDDRTG